MSLMLLSFSLFASEEKAIAVLKQVHEAPMGMTRILEGQGIPLVLVHGIDPSPAQPEWIKPIAKLIDLEKNVYFYKWDKFKTLKENQKLLADAIKEIQEEAPQLTLVGYSAGGVISIFAHDELQDDRIELHTVASPIFGYDAPSTAVFGIPFVGSTTIEIGMGAYKKLKHTRLNSCHHWINTTCELDKHACVNKKLFSAQSRIFAMPCGSENTKSFAEETHESILNKVFESIL